MEEVEVRDIITGAEEEETRRFSGMEWFETAKMKDIHIIGCGGVGSWVAVNMARFYPRSISLYDFDAVDDTNMAGQFFFADQVGTPKAAALANNIRNFTAGLTIVNTCISKFNVNETNFGNDVYIFALDDQQEKINIFNELTWRNKDKGVWLIDCRLSVDRLQIISMGINWGYNRYNECANIYRNRLLFAPEEAESTSCTMKQTTFMANLIGGLVANVYTSICMQECSEMPVPVPFFIEYYFPNYQLRIFNTPEEYDENLRKDS